MHMKKIGKTAQDNHQILKDQTMAAAEVAHNYAECRGYWTSVVTEVTRELRLPGTGCTAR
jgi:hypothetical protein